MKPNSRETLQRAIGTLEGIIAGEDLTSAYVELLANVCEMIEDVLREDEKQWNSTETIL